jgi:hypothetical protein
VVALLSLSLSLFSKENNWRVYGSGILTLDPRFSALPERVSDPEPAVLKTSQNSSTNVPSEMLALCQSFFRFFEIKKIT